MGLLPSNGGIGVFVTVVLISDVDVGTCLHIGTNVDGTFSLLEAARAYLDDANADTVTALRLAVEREEAKR